MYDSMQSSSCDLMRSMYECMCSWLRSVDLRVSVRVCFMAKLYNLFECGIVECVLSGSDLLI